MVLRFLEKKKKNLLNLKNFQITNIYNLIYVSKIKKDNLI